MIGLSPQKSQGRQGSTPRAFHGHRTAVAPALWAAVAAPGARIAAEAAGLTPGGYSGSDEIWITLD